VVISWTNNISTTNLTVNLTVPANITASVYLPYTNLAHITESGSAATTASGVISYATNNGAALFQIGSGTYSFSASP
jgi:alpha-L-rhamnosidase